MPFVGDTFNRLYNWVTDRNNGVKIQAVRMDAEFDGIATGLSTLKENATTLDAAVIKKDGTVTFTGNQALGNFRLTGVGDATALTDGLNKKTADKAVTTAGTSTAYTATSGYSLTDLTVQDGTTIRIRPHIASGATPTLAVDTMTARAIRRQDGNQIGASELVADSTYDLVFRSSNTSWYLIGAALPTITANALKVLRVNTGGTALEFANGVPSLTRSARTSNTILGLSDWGTFIDITSGMFTQTFDAVATLTSGWWCYIRNSGTGDITLDPNSTEQIDGLTSFIMYPGEVRLIQCDGVALRSIVITPFIKTFATSGTFTKPPGYSAFGGLLWGAGGSGGSFNTNAGGGGGGACAPFTLQSSLVGTTETVTIGAGGTGVSSSTGNAGGNSTFGALVTGFGGGGGPGTSSGAGGGGLQGAGGGTYGGLPSAQYNFSDSAAQARTITGVFGGGTAASSGSSLALSDPPYYGGGAGSNATETVSRNSVFGGGGGGTLASSVARTAGTSTFGGNGGAANASGNGTAGSAPGGGGGACPAANTSGAGARGELRIWGMI